MTTWGEFSDAEPDLAARVRHLFTAYKHHTMATLRRDGSPRISGTEVDFDGDGLFLGMMAGARRVLDLRRDSRLALHSHTVDPPDGDPGAWSGEAKIAGSGREEQVAGGEDGSHRFSVDITEVVFTRVGSPADHLVIEAWGPDRGLVRFRR
ncbi:MAG: pyridoxamine 5'-phosphate oxidase [Actinomycetota bacterium]|nr:pyridoxamine 5'-phosphate oxidase [Actinomycetota bacterium]